jgi:hypothetical protein
MKDIANIVFSLKPDELEFPPQVKSHLLIHVRPNLIRAIYRSGRTNRHIEFPFKE